ncbi:outer membrane receptor for ferric coprogen and ferric-rhodotorulic acid [Pseudomonas psychrotolerans]|nr:outer membrane receptor for ferric coprogen and ferric-rhodotorulic acid [Pseudomonas psychrotolerans]
MKPTLAPLAARILAAIAGTACPLVQAADSPLDLPSDTITSSVIETQEGVAQGYQGKPTTGTTRLNLTNQQTPQGVTSVTRERMDDFRQESVRDVLDYTPGINVQKVETDRTYFTSRGFDITNFQYDGSGMPFFWGVLVGDIDTAPYEQVDILHGANGVMTGLGNPSATVNFVRKRPTYTPEAEVTLSAGSWDKRRLDIDVSGPAHRIRQRPRPADLRQREQELLPGSLLAGKERLRRPVGLRSERARHPDRWLRTAEE